MRVVRVVAIYAAIGMVLASVGAGVRQNQCPSDHIGKYDILFVAALWPAMLIAGTVANAPSPCVTP